MGKTSSKEEPVHSEAPVTVVSGVLDKPCRSIDWRSKDDLLERIKAYRPPEGVSQLRILLYGPVGAGKSSSINSIQTALRGRAAILAAANATANKEKSYTDKFQTHKMHTAEGDGDFPFVFSDTMGLEQGPSGILVEDITLAMEGHMKEDYTLHQDSALSKTDHYYRKDPTLEDEFHLLVCVLPADIPEIPQTIVDKIAEIRKAAKNLDIPEMAIVTKIDLCCKEVKKDIKNVYKSKYLQKKMDELSASVGIPLNCMFPVKNYSRGNTEGDQDMDALLLTALAHMTGYGNDCIRKKLCTA